MTQTLEPFVGTWKLETIFEEHIPVPDNVPAETTFELVLDGAYLLQRTHVDHPGVPDALTVIVPDPDGDTFTQHYFDARGVVRLYDMTFDGRIWTLTRTKPDFTPLEFSQRYIGTLDDDGNAIRGAWETSDDGNTWRKDFDLNYYRTTSATANPS